MTKQKKMFTVHLIIYFNITILTHNVNCKQDVVQMHVFLHLNHMQQEIAIISKKPTKKTRNEIVRLWSL